MRGRVWAVVATVVLAAGTLECRQIVGIGDAPPRADRGDASPSCGVTVSGDACQACLASSCCDEGAACAGALPCASFEACAGACGVDVACRARCVARNPVDAQEPTTSAFEACMAAQCADACGLTCGGIVAQVVGPDVAAACQQCIAGQPATCYAAHSCARSADCQSETRCAVSSTAPDVRSACGPKVGAMFASVQSCQGPCGFGADWSCVGHVHWPPAPSCATAPVFSFGALDYLQVVPAAGLTARVCPLGEQDCNTPGATGTTDDAGAVTLPLTCGQRGYIDLSLPDGGIVPETLFWTFPATVSLQPTPPRLQCWTVTPDEQKQVAAQTGLPTDPSYGSIAVVAQDCTGTAAPGVSFDLSPKGPATRIFYQRNSGGPGTLSPTATDTDASGVAVIVNVPAGTNIDLTASPTTLGVPSSRTTVFVRAGAIASVWMLPTP